ncbi:MAG TPA: hypothetical protein VFP54_10875 [Acidimicrobiales bacterium]|nr:hypothetical protein [Acidimicrobiales bacterium]
MRTTEVHGAVAHGAVPSTQPRVAETKVTDCGRKPAGTGPPGGPVTVVEVEGAVLAVEAVGAVEAALPFVVVGAGPPDPQPDTVKAAIASATTAVEPRRWKADMGQ